MPITAPGVYDFRKLKDSDRAAQRRASALATGDLVLACGKVIEERDGAVPRAPRTERNQWKLRVLVIADGGGWPGPNVVPVVVTEAGAAYGQQMTRFNGTMQSVAVDWTDNGRKLLQVRYAYAGWSTATQSVSVDDGDDKLVVLRIVREQWVAFRVRDLKADAYVAGLQLRVQIPGVVGVQLRNSGDMFPTLFEGLPPAAPSADLLGIGTQDDTEVWVAVAIQHES